MLLPSSQGYIRSLHLKYSQNYIKNKISTFQERFMVSLEAQRSQIANERERCWSWTQLPLGPLDVQEHQRNLDKKKEKNTHKNSTLLSSPSSPS